MLAVRGGWRYSGGKTVDEIVAAKPTADFDAVWGKGFMNPDQWVKMVLL
jgi:hypothetical protein